ncbi:MAG TPA: hypothetical protein VHL59_06200, partial [Thermoanaerobaculia bacterium]|nr:hypothetical protein [Thermoanaerobaculia bacterium]
LVADRVVDDLLRLVPDRLDAADEPLIRRALEELHKRSFRPSELAGPIEQIVDYAIRHELPGLDGLATLVHAPQTLPPSTRARLAIAIGRAQDATRIELADAVPNAPEWVPYHRERALFEARDGDAAAAEAQLRRAASAGADPRVTETAAQVAAILGNDAAAARYRQELAALAHKPRVWTGTCGGDELCDWARTRVYVTGGAIELALDVVQSDQTPPYVEIFVDDARAAEGLVDGERRFVVPAANGVRRVEVRLVNRATPGGAQRRVRLS